MAKAQEGGKEAARQQQQQQQLSSGTFLSIFLRHNSILRVRVMTPLSTL